MIKYLKNYNLEVTYLKKPKYHNKPNLSANNMLKFEKITASLYNTIRTERGSYINLDKTGHGFFGKYKNP